MKDRIFGVFLSLSTKIYMRRALFLTFWFVAVSAAFCSVHAQEISPAHDAGEKVDEKTIPKAALMGLAKDFMRRVSKGFAAADQAMGESSPTKEDMIARMAEGEELLLKVVLEGGVTLTNPLLGIVQQGKIVLSLRDFANSLELPITVDPAAGKATGWYIRENKTFDLDIANRSVKTDNGAFTFSSHVSVMESDIFVPVEEIAAWFGFTIDLNIAGLSLAVKTPVPLPILERITRGKQQLPGKGLGPAQLPLMAEAPPVADIPFVDVSTRSAYKKDGQSGRDAQFTNNASIVTAGDFAGGTLRTQAHLDDKELLSSLGVNYQRKSMEPELLGPLKARLYEVGDINTVRMPLDQGGQTGLGVYATNALPIRNFFSPSTTITGIAFPNWDAELYRDNQLLSFQKIGDDGTYRFEDVDLFSSDNNFKVVLYGPQGEVREEDLYIPVDPDRLAEGGSAYAVSVTRQNAHTYSRGPEDEENNGVHVAGVYETPVGDKSVLALGMESGEVNGAQKGSAQAGLSTSIAKTLFNLSGAVDTNSEMAVELVARREFRGHRLRNETNWATEKYKARTEGDIAEIFSNRFGLTGPLPGVIGKRPRYNFDLGYMLDSEGENSTNVGAGFNTTWGRIGFNQQLEYGMSSRAEESTLDGATAFFGTLGRNRLRFGANYQFQPDSDLQSIAASFNRDLTKNLDLQVGVSRNINTKLTEASAQINWDAKFARISPGVTYNTDKDLTATLNTHFGLARDPHKETIRMLSRPLASMGGLTAFVFLDKNGDGEFDEGDTPIPDARVASLQSGGRQKTDAEGYAFFPSMPELLRTDIVLDPNSLADPFWIPGFEGVSVIPRVGHVSEVEFPVHMAGEMDGTLYIKSGGGTEPLRGMRIRLYDESGKVQDTAVTGPDGFYVFSKIPPGEYTLVINSDDAAANKFVRPESTDKIVIGYDGTMIYGHDVYVAPGHDIATKILAEIPEHAPSNAGLVKPGAVFINLGSFNSRLLMGLTWYRLKMQYADAIGGAVPLVPVTASEAVPKTGKHTLRVVIPGDTMKQAMERCKAIAQGGFSCVVETLPEKMKLASAE